MYESPCKACEVWPNLHNCNKTAELCERMAIKGAKCNQKRNGTDIIKEQSQGDTLIYSLIYSIQQQYTIGEDNSQISACC